MARTLVLLLVGVVACGAPLAASPTVTPSATSSPAPTPIPLPSYAQVNAPMSSVVWVLVAGTRLFRSTDRGDTWEERSMPTPARDPVLSFVSEREGWVASAGSPGPCQARPGPLWHTIDGGATWHEAAMAGIAAAPCPASLAFTHAQHGFVAALDEKRVPVIYTTMDGAKSWTASEPLEDPAALPMQGGRPDLELGRVRVFGSTLLVTARIPAPAGPSTHVYRSQDGGATWTYAAAIPSAGTFAIVTAARWLRLGSPGASFQSTDAGATWHEFATDHAQAAPIAPDVVFADPNVGYATVRGALQRTIDGGAHWTALRTPGTD